jgi:hypothetical protein
MAKSLKDIIGPRAGRNLAKGEEDFLDQHKVDEKDYPVKQKHVEQPHKTNVVKHQPDEKHGYTKSGEAETKYKSANEEVEDLDEAGVRSMRRAGRTHNVDKNYLMRFNPYSKKSYKDPNEKSKEDSKKETDKLVGDYLTKGGKIKKEDVELDEVLKSSDPTSMWISDFVHSKNPKFADKSKKERIQMALGAKYAKMREEFEQSLVENDEDYEGEMAKTQLKAMANKAMQLVMMLKDDQELEAWVQSKLTRAKADIDGVFDYMMYSEPKDEEQPEKESAPVDYPMTFPGMNVDTAFGKV